MTFGIEIRKLRISKGLRIRELAAALEVDSATISKIERGSRNATKEQVIMLAKVFNQEQDKMMALWLGTKVYDLLKDDPTEGQALNEAQKMYKTKKRK